MLRIHLRLFMCHAPLRFINGIFTNSTSLSSYHLSQSRSSGSPDFFKLLLFAFENANLLVVVTLPSASM